MKCLCWFHVFPVGVVAFVLSAMRGVSSAFSENCIVRWKLINREAPCSAITFNFAAFVQC